MNQPTPPPDDTNPDAKPDDEPAARWEEPKPDDEARLRSEEAKPDDGARMRSDAPKPDDEARMRSDEPKPESGSAGARWEEPQPTGGAYREANAPRPRHPIEENLTRKSTWARLVFIVLFAIAWWIAEFVLTAVVVIQFLVVLFTGEPNERLRAFGQSLSRYAYQLFRYMTFNSDERPFPLDLDWPSGERDPASS